jgi:hypothetical protein
MVILHLTIFWVVICEGETSLNPLPLFLSNPRLPGMSPLGLATLNRKDLPIVVTLGGVGPCFANLTLILQLLDLNYKLSDNRSEGIDKIQNCLKRPHKPSL